jgi:sec-independent protein translocase protein TatA
MGLIEDLLKPQHLLVILVIALLVMGPSKLPEIGKGLAEGIRNFKDAFKAPPPAPPTPEKKDESTKQV